MAENVWKRIINNVSDSDTNISWLTSQSNWWSPLSFSKWFSYQDQNLQNYTPTVEESMKLNDEKASKFMWIDISSKKMSDKEIDDFIWWLDNRQIRRITTNRDSLSTNAMVEYINNWDERKDPFASWTWMFEKKSSAGNTYWKPIWWTAWALWGREIAWRTTTAIWDYKFNKTMDKYLPEDVARITRYTKYDKVPDVLSKELAETNEQIEKAEQRLWKSMKNKLVNWWVSDETRRNLEELYARRDAIKDSLDAIESTKKKIPSGKPETARETAKKMNLVWDDLRAAWQAATQSQVYYTTEIAPLYKQVKTRFNMWKIFDSLTKDDFPWLDEDERKDMKELIDKKKKAYSKYTDLSAEELHKKLSDFDLSKQRIKWEESKWLNAQFKDAIHTKINNMLDDAVETELPWKWIKNKKLTYSNMLNIENELKDYAVSWWKRKNQSVLKDIKDNTTRSIKIKRWLWTKLREAWKYRPSTFIMKVIDRFKKEPQKVIEKGKEIVEKWTESPTVKKVVENKKLVNPKSATQPKLFWSPMDFATVALWDMLEMWWLESPLEVLTEIVSYALETYNLNKERWQDLSLYDKENSYVNQNSYNWISRDDRRKKLIDTKWYDFLNEWSAYNKYWDKIYRAVWLDELQSDKSMYEQDWYKALLEEEAKSDEKYRESIKDTDIEKILNSIK